MDLGRPTFKLLQNDQFREPKEREKTNDVGYGSKHHRPGEDRQDAHGGREPAESRGQTQSCRGSQALRYAGESAFADEGPHQVARTHSVMGLACPRQLQRLLGYHRISHFANAYAWFRQESCRCLAVRQTRSKSFFREA